MKLKKWYPEYTITLLILFAIGLIFMPVSIKSTTQAGYITKWSDCYKKLNYAHDAILKQEQSKILMSIRNAATPKAREDLVIEIMKPYFRLDESPPPKRYKVKYMDKSFVGKKDTFYIEDYYKTNGNIIVGIKDIPDPEGEDTQFLMTFDVNGLMPPNTWGKDIFGTVVYNRKVEPIGNNLRIDEQGIDCSPLGTGTSCSNYYLIGGGFND